MYRRRRREGTRSEEEEREEQRGRGYEAAEETAVVIDGWPAGRRGHGEDGKGEPLLLLVKRCRTREIRYASKPVEGAQAQQKTREPRLRLGSERAKLPVPLHRTECRQWPVMNAQRKNEAGDMMRGDRCR